MADEETDDTAEDENELTIASDDEPEDIIENVNRVLRANGFEFVEEDDDSDGTILYRLRAYTEATYEDA